VFVWVFHRISGLLLIFLLAFQLVTGLFQASISNSQVVKTIAGLHNHAVLNSLLAFLVIFHGLYGVRTILMDLGVRRERLLFWTCTILGLALFVGFLAALAMVYA
jgi:succinate dehydrogenase/fumarate reductase cytochrome b subunit